MTIPAPDARLAETAASCTPTRHRGLIALILASSLCAQAQATEVYVDPVNGADTNNGTSTASPLQTINAAAAATAAGDTIHLICGGTFRTGNVTINGAAVVAYGSGAAPVITATQVVGGWTAWAGHPGVLTAYVNGPVLALYAQGTLQTLARTPNIDAADPYLHNQNATDADSLVVPSLSGDNHIWTGAEVRWRRWSWWWETRPITDDDGAGKLSLGADGRFHDAFTGDGSAFYVDGCLALVDAPGEWFYDQPTTTLYLYPPADARAGKPLVEVVTGTACFGCSGATIDSIAFARIAGSALKIGKPSMVRNCIFQDIGDDAISSSWDCGGSHVSGCTFLDVRNVAIYWLENPGGPGGTIIENNNLERIGMVFGYGGSGSWRGAGMIINKGKAVTVRGNRMVDIGNNGIIVGAPGVIVERNVFVRCMGSLNDGAGIYVCANAAIIRDNIVLDTVGNLDTSHWWFPLGHGIWTEFLSDFHDQVIAGNTVFGCGGHGLFLTNNYHCQVQDNVLVGNRLSALHVSGKNGKAQDNRFADNILVAIDPPRRLTFPENIPANWKGNDFARCIDAGDASDFGHMSGTTLVASPGLTLISQKGKHVDDPLAWKAADSWADPDPKVVRAVSLLLINDTDAVHEFPAPAGGWHQLDGKAIAKGLAIAPFRSQVVVRTGDGTGVPPYILASGIDYRAPAPPSGSGKPGKH